MASELLGKTKKSCSVANYKFEIVEGDSPQHGTVLILALESWCSQSDQAPVVLRLAADTIVTQLLDNAWHNHCKKANDEAK